MTAPRPIPRDAFASENEAFVAGRLGLRVFLLSLGSLFAAALIGSIIMLREAAEVAPEAAVPPLPQLLWISTLVLALSSASMQWALVAIRANRVRSLQTGLMVTLALALSFLGLQVACWAQWRAAIAGEWERAADFRYLLAAFHVLTGLHALHVVGGLVPMLVIARRSMALRYDAQRHRGVHHVAMYWHFLGAVWIVLYAALLILM